MKKTLRKFFLLAVAGVLALSAAACDEEVLPVEPTVDWANVGEYAPTHYETDKVANGAYSYVAASYEERTKILGLLEKYATSHFLTGMTMYENGGYVMYNDGIVKGTNNYIAGYGFGILSEGSINADLEGEENAAWKRYLHSYQTDDPKTVQYMNDKGSVVGDLQSYLGSSYWTTQMNSTKDGYEWVAATAKDARPVALNADDNGLATKYRLEVTVNSDEFRYGTATQNETLARYNGQHVKLEDYITPYKVYYTKAYAMARGNENLDGAGSIKGSAEYYEKSANGFNAQAWENIGIKAVEEGGKSYLEFEFNIPCNTFYAMYYLSSSMFTPVPAEFIQDLGVLSAGDKGSAQANFDNGVAIWGNMNDKGTKLGLIDTYLSSGPYLVEHWESDKQIVFSRNEGYAVEGPNRYKIAGVHFNILAAAKSDPLAVFNEFMVNKLHSVALPKDKLQEYKSDPRTTTTVGDSTFKLNYNTCSPEYWLYLFGENGAISETAPSDYWQLEPAMSNANFVNGLSYAFDRATLAETIGRTPSTNYFGSSYLSNPEEGIMFNDTQEHKDAVNALNANTNYGYNLEYARASFKKACEELIAAGYYKAGDTLTVEIAWQTTSDIDDFGDAIAKNWEDAFNSCEGGLKLKVKHWVGQQWSDVYYEKMMKGQFDIGFGSISGNTLNPLNFLEVLKSDNSSGFTLNWGSDTSVISKDLFYDGVYWSFDGLWQAADTGAYFVDGVVQSAFTVQQVIDAPVANEDGTLTVKMPVSIAVAEGLNVEVKNVVIYGYIGKLADDAYAESDAVSFEVVTEGEGEEAQTYVVANFSAEDYTKFSGAVNELGYLGFDIYYTQTTCGVGSDSYTSVYFTWPTAE